MGQRVIPVAVTAEYIGGDGVTLGAAGSHSNVVIEYDFRAAGPMWEPPEGGTLIKYVLWTNPQGNTTNRVDLGVDMLVPGYDSKVYHASPTADAMCVAGWAEMVVVGAIISDGDEIVKVKTEPSRFRVLPGSSRAADNEGIAATVADQLQSEIETVDSRKVSKPLAPLDPDGTDGQFLVSRENGATEWVDMDPGLVEAAIEKHPEWVTTIRDGAVTKRKLADDVLGEFTTLTQELIDQEASISNARNDINDLTQAAATKEALSEAVEEIHQHLTSPYIFRGALASSASLPAASAANANHTYYLIQEKHRVTSNGSTWEQSSMDENDYSDELTDLRGDLEFAFNEAESYLFPQLEQGNITAAGGEEPTSKCVRSAEFILVPANSLVSIKYPDEFAASMYFYTDESYDTYVDSTAQKFRFVPTARYLKFKLSHESQRSITPEEVPCVLTITPPPNEIYSAPDDDAVRIADHTRYHVRKIDLQESRGLTYKKDGDSFTSVDNRPASKFIRCKPTDTFNLVFKPSGDITIGNAYVYVYVYNENLELVPGYFFSVENGNSYINRIFSMTLLDISGNQIANIPDGYYIQFVYGNAPVDVFMWDGKSFGLDVRTQTDTWTGTAIEKFPADGGMGIIVPTDVQYLIAKPGYTFLRIGRLQTSGPIDGSMSSTTRLVPSQIIWTARHLSPKLVTVVKNYDYSATPPTYDKVSEFGELTSSICAVRFADYSVVPLQGLSEFTSRKILDNLMALKWIAKRNFYAASSFATFKEGVTYNSVPYGSRWTSASWIGWHVSSHTFINAANDERSIFNDPNVSFKLAYDQKTGEFIGGDHSGGFYGLVCSAFGTMFAGFPYPMTNQSFMSHPYVQTTVTPNLHAGELYSNGIRHCFIVLETVAASETEKYYVLAEEITPVLSLTSHYKSVSNAQGSAVDAAYAYGMTFPYEIAFKTSVKQQFNIYNITDQTIIGGSARPYKGDRCVYTSEERVLINIHNSAANTLIVNRYTLDNNTLVYAEQVAEIDINGAQQIEISKDVLVDGGFYSVCTNNDSTQEYFEYHAPEHINYSIDENGVFHCNAGAVDNKDPFWYVELTSTNGDIISVGFESTKDYSIYADYVKFRRGSNAYFFKHGTFGAYIIPSIIQ